MAGEIGLLLYEEPAGWAITRGTTKGESKFIPMTPTDIIMRISAGRAMLNYVVANDRYDLLEGANLNLNFPSVIGSVKVGESTYRHPRLSTRYRRRKRSTPSAGIRRFVTGRPVSSWPTKNAGMRTLRWWVVWRRQLSPSAATSAAPTVYTPKICGRWA
jgi:hypothetical protein